MSQDLPQHNDMPAASFAATARLLFRVLWQANPFFLLSVMLLTLLSGAVLPLTILLNAALLDLIVRSLTTPLAPSSIPGSALLLLFLLGGVIVGGQLVTRLQQSVKGLFQKKVSAFITLLIAEKASQLDLAFFENPTFHNRLSNATSEAAYRPITILEQLLTLCSTLITAIWVGIFLLQWHWWIVLLVVAISALRYWLAARQGKAQVKLTQEQTPLQRTGVYVNSVLTFDLFAKELRLFGLAPFLLARYRALSERLYQGTRDHERRFLIVSLITEPMFMLTRPTLIAYTVLQVFQRAISVGQFSIYTQSIGQLDSGLFTIITTGAQLYENLLFLTNLATFLRYTPAVERPRPPSALPAGMNDIPPMLEFRDVSFSYPDAPKPVFDHLSFQIASGETVALVGKNGAGKTTLVKLLAGLYEPTGGQIFLNGVDIATLDRRELRTCFSVIFQDYALYHFSAADNIGFGQIDAISDQPRIERAAERSGFASVIQSFPEGYETVLGRFIERGQEISGGQRQLLALARALMRDAPVLILDEPGAALDIENESALFQRLLADRQERRQTIIFISHRFSTVQRANHILVLEEGHLIEEGSHEQLMLRQGRYAHLFAMQARSYGNMEDTAPRPAMKLAGAQGELSSKRS